LEKTPTTILTIYLANSILRIYSGNLSTKQVSERSENKSMMWPIQKAKLIKLFDNPLRIKRNAGQGFIRKRPVTIPPVPAPCLIFSNCPLASQRKTGPPGRLTLTGFTTAPFALSGAISSWARAVTYNTMGSFFMAADIYLFVRKLAGKGSIQAGPKPPGRQVRAGKCVIRTG
jgi:hypothetical protein